MEDAPITSKCPTIQPTLREIGGLFFEVKVHSLRSVTSSGAGATTPANTDQVEVFAKKVANLQRANDEKDARFQAMREELDALKTSVAKRDIEAKNQKSKMDNLNDNFVKHVQDTNQKLEQSKEDTAGMIDKTRVGLMNAVDRVGSHSKLNEKRIKYNETKNQVRAALIMNPNSISTAVTTVEQLEELEFVQASEIEKATKSLVEQGKALTEDKEQMANGKSLVNYEQSAIAVDPSFGQSLQSANRSIIAPETNIDQSLKYETVKDQQALGSIFGFYDSLRADIRNVVAETLKNQSDSNLKRHQPEPMGGPPPEKQPVTITPPLSQHMQSVSFIVKNYNYKSIVDSVDLLIQDNSSDHIEHDGVNSTASEKPIKRRRSKELTSNDITDLSNQIQKKIKVDEKDTSDIDMGISSPEYKTADEEDNDKPGDMLDSPNGTLQPTQSSSPKPENVEKKRASENDFHETDPDVFSAGTRNVGSALSTQKPQLPHEWLQNLVFKSRKCITCKSRNMWNYPVKNLNWQLSSTYQWMVAKEKFGYIVKN